MKAPLLAAALLALVPRQTLAQAPGREGPFVTLRGGIAGPPTPGALDPGAAVEVAAGKRYSEHVALELSAGWLRLGASRPSNRDPFGNTPLIRTRIREVPVLVTARPILPIGPLELSATLGAGLSFAAIREEILFAVEPVPAVSAGVGLSARVTERLQLAAEVKYLFARVRPTTGEVQRELGILTAGLAYAL